MNNNLVHVLSKIQFGRLTDSQLRDKADSIKGYLRKDYPQISPVSEQKVVELQVGPAGQEVKETATPFLAAASAKKDWGVRVTPDYLLLHTSNYSSFEDFYKRMDNILSILTAELPIYHKAFVGIRYINKYELDSSTDEFPQIVRKDFLQSQLNGFSMAGANSISRYKASTGYLQITSGVEINPLKYPNDIADLTMDLSIENSKLNGPWANLDLDAFNKFELEDFDKGEVLSCLAELKSSAKNAYQEITS